jgi:hypothetical protein
MPTGRKLPKAPWTRAPSEIHSAGVSARAPLYAAGGNWSARSVGRAAKKTRNFDFIANISSACRDHFKIFL